MKNLAIKLFLSTLCFAVNISSVLACTVCKSNQPKLLQGITHGGGPESDWDYVIISFMVLIVLGTFILSVRQLIKPGERNANHIKHSILNR